MKILIIDGEATARVALRDRLAREGHQILEAADAPAALELVCRENPDLALLSPSGGAELLPALRAASAKLGFVLVADGAPLAEAVVAAQGGAPPAPRAPELVARAGVSLDMLRLIRRAAESQAPTVLLRGESGTGKDMAARALHAASARASKPFVHASCAAPQDGPLEIELFGHETAGKRGLFERADGGTLFLDEIADTGPALQAKILRVIEEKAVRPIGGERDVRVDVRLVAASNQDLEKLIEAKRFRQDLFYRLNLITITVPALRDRREDIPALAEHFLRVCSEEFRRPATRLSEEALAKLRDYDWPGNVRELRNVVERAVLLAEGPVIGPDDLRFGAGEPRRDAERLVARLLDDGYSLEQIERAAVVEALQRAEGNRTRAGELLGLSRDRVRLRMIKFGLREPASS